MLGRLPSLPATLQRRFHARRPTHLRLRWRLPRLSLLLAPLLAGATSVLAATTPPRTLALAIVHDGTSRETAAQIAILQQEIRSLAGRRYQPTFPASAQFDAGWDLNQARAQLERAAADPTIDGLVVLGPITTTAATAPSLRLTKPTFGALLTHPDFAAPESPPAPADTDANRLTLVTIQPSVDTFAPVLRRLLSAPTTLYVLTDLPAAPATLRWCDRLAAALGARVEPRPFGATVEATLNQLPAEARQVLCLPTLRFDRDQRADLFRLWAARRVAVFSFAGRTDVEAGALAANLPDTDLMLARALAIRIDQFAGGPAPRPLGSTLPVQPQLFLNARTARTLGRVLEFQDLHHATVLGRTTGLDGPPLTVTQAVLQALETSFTLKMRAEGSVQARETERLAVAALGPRVAATYRHQQVDRDRAEFAGVVLPATNVRAGLALEQPLLDDEAWARSRAAREAYRAAGEQEKSARLEVIERTLLAYLDTLSAAALLRIAEDNLNATTEHLALARLREHAGTSGPEEVLRFATAAAQHRGEVATARARLARARVALNRACNYEPDTAWRVEDLDLQSPAFAFSTRTVAPRLRHDEDLDRFRAWCAAYALAHSPDLGTLECQLQAQRLVVAQQARRPWVPRVTVAASLDRVVDQELGGPPLLEQLVRRGVLPPPDHLPDRTEWGVALSAQLPLFTSGALPAELRRARSALRQLEWVQADARAAIVARARAAFHALTGSYPNLELSALAAQHADRHLALTREKYERGTVSILALLDAQATAFSARQGAALAQYRFLADLVSFHRALGWHEVLGTSEEKEAFARDLVVALGTAPATP